MMDDTFPLSLKCLRMLYCDRFWLPYIAVLHDGALHKQPTVSAVLSTRDDSTDSETAVQQGCPTLAATAIHHEVSRSNCFSSSNFPLSVCLSVSVSLSVTLCLSLSGNYFERKFFVISLIRKVSWESPASHPTI